MNFRKIYFSLILIFGLVAGANASNEVESTINTIETVDADYILHTVVRGETVFSIAQTYKVDVKEIYRLNPTAEEGIRVGENLLVPSEKPMPVRYIEHIVAAKETLYGVSKTYAIKVEDIMVANTGLDASSFKVGERIRIPVFEKEVTEKTTIQQGAPLLAETHKEYTVGKRETLYGISKAWNISIDEILASNPAIKIHGLKEGMTIFLPHHTEETSFIANNIRGFFSSDSKVRIGILLPFLIKNGVVDRTKVVEYYEGLLLALKESKKKGLDAEVYTFDIGPATNTARLESILETTEAKSLSLVIGGITEEQIKVISKFSRERGIKYVVPFGTLEDELAMNPYIYQATNSHTNLFLKVADMFRTTYRPSEYNIIFLNDIDAGVTKNGFIDVLKTTLVRAKVPFKNVNMSFEQIASFTSELDNTKKNVIIPSSASEATLKKTISLLNYAKTQSISLFGYPEWQVYSSFRKDLHRYDTNVYSMFYFDSRQELVTKFDEEYKEWYGKTLVNSYPKYAHLGYDTGLYFFAALNRYGNTFQAQIGNMIVPSIQSAIYYEKTDENGGYVNNGLYFIHYKPDLSVEKYDINR